ncbi:hypothetical protein SteCoe_10198 [Stentor coeruleus]|uniref:Uncharacterized protein n=1 Tax=Stentor coeruleus TaxID=5963 RepID=A0A1R2CG35_9CILI|nr:hypothetical protein SteCoe_10198 [Stentor coeruleus]
MKRDFVNVLQTPDRKKNLHFQVFPTALNPLNSKTPISTSTKSHLLISENQFKPNHEKSYKKKHKIPKKNHSKSPIKGDNLYNNPHFATSTLTISPSLMRPMYLSQVLKKTSKEPLTESYKLRITEANLKYLKSRFSDVNNRLEKILDLASFDKNKRYSPESKKHDFSFLRASARSINNELGRERAELGKSVNMKSRVLLSSSLGPLYACK